MKKTFLITLFAVLVLPYARIKGQELKNLNLDQVIQLAETQSPNAMIARQRFRNSYWQYRTFVAQYLPSVTLTGTTPDYSTAYTRVYNSLSGEFTYVPTNMLQNLGSLAITQNIGLTGGSIALQSDFTLQNDFEKDNRTYVTTPISVRLTQPVFRYNSLKWQKKTEPLRYDAAKKTYIENIESVHQQAVTSFFSLALAQINLQIANMNYSNADTLWRIAQGRYTLGTISQDELLQMKLSWLNAETERKQAAMNLRDREIRLRSFLGFSDNVRLALDLPTKIPDLQVDSKEVFDLAMKNNPEIVNQTLAVLTAQSALAQANGDRGFNANIFASFGLQGKDPMINTAYSTLSRNQGVRFGFTLPILDWGLLRGKYLMAKSALELAKVQSAQSVTDFQQNLLLSVEQFNLQKEQVAIAAESDTVAMQRYEVTKQRFLIGKIAVLDLQDADSRKDQNRRAYVQSLQDYWNYFYNMRALTLFDFIKKKPLEADYAKLLE